MMPASKPAPRAWVKIIVDHNPFYLLSAVSMLLGCLLLTSSLSFSPVPMTRILMLIGTLQVYELMLVGIGVFLLKRDMLRDACWLIGLEIFFLVDAAFLCAELFELNFPVGLAVNTAIWLLGAIKLWWIFRATKLPTDGLYVYSLVAIALLLAVPGFLAYRADQDEGVITALAMYTT